MLTKRGKIIRTVFYLACAFMLTTTSAAAYIDPATTSYIIQIAVGVVIAFGTAFGIIWNKFKRVIKKKSRTGQSESDIGTHVASRAGMIIKAEDLLDDGEDEVIKRLNKPHTGDACVPESVEDKKFDLKDALKKLTPAYIITFVFSFMLFFFEPIQMYSTNMNDFWFDLNIMMPPLLAGFGLILLGGLILPTAVYFINRAFSKKLKIYYCFVMLEFLMFLAAYIQGNFLAGHLPALSGASFQWSEYTADDIVTLIIWTVLAAAAIFLITKLEFAKIVKYMSIVSVVVFVMLSVSLGVKVLGNDATKKKGSMVAQNVNFSSASSDKNFLIFLVDAVSSEDFENVVNENEEYKRVFEDFTFFPDTLGAYPCTRDTIPLILSGHLSKNEMPFDDFSSGAYNDSPLFDKLTEQNYEINLYDPYLIWNGETAYEIANSVSGKDTRLNFNIYFEQELKYILFKYLPYGLKGYSGIESMDFNLCIDVFRWDDPTVYNSIKNTPELEKKDKNVFQFIHTEGAHIPFNYDKDLNSISDGTYEQKIEASITMLDAYIRRLKENGVYDNSVIIIMADHGNTNLNTSNDMFVRANPLLLIKGVGERHDFAVSDFPVSYLELMDVYSDLLDGQSSTEWYSDMDRNRTRTFMWYDNFGRENHMVEYAVSGHARDWEDFKDTGKVYDLEQ